MSAKKRKYARNRKLKLSEHASVDVTGYLDGNGVKRVRLESGYAILTLSQVRRLMKMFEAAVADAESGEYC